MEVGFVGLGAMGSAMAANLVKAGHRVRAWDRSGKGSEGVEIVAKPADAFQAEVVFTMLSDDSAIREVLLNADVLETAHAGVVHVVTSTISVAFAGELAATHEKAGIGYVSAPVLGRPDVAKEGQLNILAAGKRQAVEKARPLLEVLAKKVWDMGEEPARANAAKIAANMMITMAIEAMAEAVVLTEASGLPRDAFFELILGTLFGGRSYESYSANIAKGSFEPGFKARLGLKDLGLAAAAAEKAGNKGDKVVAFCDRNCNVIAPFIPAPGHLNESPLLRDASPEAMRIAGSSGLDLRGTIVSLDGFYDCARNRKAIFNRAMVPNINPNPRNRKSTKRGRKPAWCMDPPQWRFDRVRRRRARCLLAPECLPCRSS